MEDVGLVVVVRVVVAVTDVYGMVAVAVHGHGCCLCVLQTTTAISNAHCVGNAKGWTTDTHQFQPKRQQEENNNKIIQKENILLVKITKIMNASCPVLLCGHATV